MARVTERHFLRLRTPYLLRIAMGRFGRLSALHGALLGLGLFGITISLVGFPTDSLIPLLLGVAGIIASLVGILAQIIEDWGRVSRIYRHARTLPFVAPYAPPYDNWSHLSFNGFSSVHHEDLDARLRSGSDIPLQIGRTMWEAPAECEEARRMIRVLLDFDDDKIRLSDDLLPDSTSTLVQKTQYSAHTVTNLLGEVALRERRRQRDLVSSESVLLRNGVVPRLKYSRCSNHLGVDVVGVTSGGRVVLTLQGEKNDTNQGMLAASGSGSMDWKDLRGCTNVVDLAKKTMIREMSEELGITDRRTIGMENIRVLRYVRVTNWGGKPQFCGVARLDEFNEEVRGIERRYHRDHFSIEFDPDRGPENFALQIRAYVTENAKRISFPLYETLQSLCHWLDHDPEAWTWLMGRDNSS